MSDETRDESGRLVSVVVDGQRFHRADEIERLREIARQYDESSRLYAEQFRASDAEVRSLRGVVQAARELLPVWASRAGEYVNIAPLARAATLDCYDELRAALAAAADAPQPEPAPTSRGFATPEPCGTATYREMSMLDRPEFSRQPGPSPAVLPEKEQR